MPGAMDCVSMYECMLCMYVCMYVYTYVHIRMYIYCMYECSCTYVLNPSDMTDINFYLYVGITRWYKGI